MFLYIVRHAWAYEHGDARWPDDSQRPLEADGAERFVRVLERLAECGFAPALIAASPYVRCRQTAELVAAHAGGLRQEHTEVVELSALTPGSDFAALCTWSNEHAHRGALCWVGHAPDVGLLAAALVGDGQASLRFAKGSVAAIRIHGEIGYDSGELHWLATAKLLGL